MLKASDLRKLQESLFELGQGLRTLNDFETKLLDGLDEFVKDPTANLDNQTRDTLQKSFEGLRKLNNQREQVVRGMIGAPK
jgi:hypothetical protein